MSKHINKFFNVITNIITILMIIIIGIVMYNLIQIQLFNKEYSNLFGYTIFQVATGSMSGTIEAKDLILVKLDKKDIQQNDIIVFKQENYIITHRIIELTEDNIITKGDANNTEDTPITMDNVIGKVVKIIPNIYIWEKVFATPKVFISLLITFVLLIIVFSYKDDKSINNSGDLLEEQKTNHDAPRKE